MPKKVCKLCEYKIGLSGSSARVYTYSYELSWQVDQGDNRHNPHCLIDSFGGGLLRQIDTVGSLTYGCQSLNILRRIDEGSSNTYQLNELIVPSLDFGSTQYERVTPSGQIPQHCFVFNKAASST